jgi:hypothetical protein
MRQTSKREQDTSLPESFFLNNDTELAVSPKSLVQARRKSSEDGHKFFYEKTIN